MIAAWLLTLFALSGIGFGVFLGRSRTLSPQLAAAGGGLLAGIAVWWVVPEVVESIGWQVGIALPCFSFALLFGFDTVLHRIGHSGLQSSAGPLLAAASIHSFLDGWSVRVLSVNPMASVAVLLGLALHKVPEGLALGLVSRKSLAPAWRAFAASAAVESLTVVGALVEPRADQAGFARFGALWTAVILAVVSGSFLFLGVHTVRPERHKTGVVAIFLSTFAAAAVGAVARERWGSS